MLSMRSWEPPEISHWDNSLPAFLAKRVNRGRPSQPLCEGQINILKTQDCEVNGASVQPKPLGVYALLVCITASNHLSL